jgi:CopG family transcriptional regulator, nickel-responsive regulator
MTIVSLSLNDEILGQLDHLAKEQRFSGRSEAVRAAVRMFADEYQQKKKLTGTRSAVLLVTYEERYAEDFAVVRHKHLRIIRTQLHDHLDDHRCMELLLLRGDSKDIVKLSQDCSSIKGANAKLIAL